MTDAAQAEAVGPDPRSALADWANRSDEWTRFIVRQVLSTGRPLASNDVDYAYSLFRQEKSLDERVLPLEAQLEVEASQDVADLPLAITKVSDITGVNALVSGAVIEPHAGLTILFGENGTGKTGYARIFKALADSRTADVILGDITGAGEEGHSARIAFTLGRRREGAPVGRPKGTRALYAHVDLRQPIRQLPRRRRS